MPDPKPSSSWSEQLERAIAELVAASESAAQAAVETVTKTTEVAAQTGETLGKVTHQLVEQSTTTIGHVVTPILDNPFVRYAAKFPGVGWLLTALGQVNPAQAQAEIQTLRQTYAQESAAQLAHRVMVDTALKAAGVGIVTNIVPPIALMLFAVDIAAVTALQAGMVYRIAGIYGLPLDAPARRGEVLAIFGLAFGGSSALKVGLSLVEALPIVGPVIGAASDAALIYGLGYVACRYYEAKQAAVK